MNERPPDKVLNEETGAHVNRVSDTRPDTRNQPGLWPKPTTPIPTEEQLRWWVFDSVCEATDGCEIEPDGQCEHGHPSWLIRLGMV